MKTFHVVRLLAVSFSTGALLGACGGSPAPEPVMPAPPVESAPAAPSAPTAAPAAATEPTPEEKKLAAEQKALAEYTKARDDAHTAELARIDATVRAEAKALADKAYPSTRAAIQAVAKGKHRKPGNADRDTYRHPAETLEFFGLKPTMTVLEYGPGDGWFTELLAPALAKKGKLIVTSGDPNGPAGKMSTEYAKTFRMFLDRLPEAYGKVETVVVDSKAEPKLGLDGKLDMVIATRELHGLQNRGTLDAWLKEFHKALKPGGILAIEQHRAKEDGKPEETSKKGYLPEKWVIERVTAAGFKLAGKSELNANPKDTKDYAEGVWALPPNFAMKDQDRAKFAAIGESDRMTLKFTKVGK
jgi:predicted methyltransferase